MELAVTLTLTPAEEAAIGILNEKPYRRADLVREVVALGWSKATAYRAIERLEQFHVVVAVAHRSKILRTSLAFRATISDELGAPYGVRAD